MSRVSTYKVNRMHAASWVVTTDTINAAKVERAVLGAASRNDRLMPKGRTPAGNPKNI